MGWGELVIIYSISNYGYYFMVYKAHSRVLQRSPVHVSPAYLTYMYKNLNEWTSSSVFHIRVVYLQSPTNGSEKRRKCSTDLARSIPVIETPKSAKKERLLDSVGNVIFLSSLLSRWCDNVGFREKIPNKITTRQWCPKFAVLLDFGAFPFGNGRNQPSR